MVKFYELQKHEPCSKKLTCNNHLKKQETNGEGTIALSQMSSTFQLPLKKSGHHFCFFYRLLTFSSMDLHNFNLRFGVHPSLQVEPSNSHCFHQRFKTHLMQLFYLVCLSFVPKDSTLKRNFL